MVGKGTQHRHQGPMEEQQWEEWEGGWIRAGDGGSTENWRHKAGATPQELYSRRGLSYCQKCDPKEEASREEILPFLSPPSFWDPEASQQVCLGGADRRGQLLGHRPGWENGWGGVGVGDEE